MMTKCMKKQILLGIACLMTTFVVSATEPTPADQKWLQAVEKMVAKGEKKVTTANEERVNLAKEWADKNGYSVKVTKAGNSFNLEFAIKETTKNVAQK